MTKDAVQDWSSTPADNTDIAGIGITGSSPVSNFDGAMRTMMAQLKIYTTTRGFLYSQDYGVTGDGTTDDTAAMQDAIDDAIAQKKVLIIQAGSIKLTSLLTGTGRLVMWGAGRNGDEGWGYANEYTTPHTPTTTTGFSGTVFVCGNHSFLDVISNSAVSLSGFEVRYPSRPSDSTFAIKLRRAVVSSNVNIASTMRDLYIQGCAQGIIIQDCYDWVIDNCQVRAAFIRCIQCTNTIYPNWADATICNSMLWADMSSTEFLAHVEFNGGGGYRVINNKFNYGDHKPNNIYAIKCNMTLSSSQFMEPIIIIGNSIEGMTSGVLVTNASNSSARLSQLILADNQFWVRYHSLKFIKHTGDFVDMATVTGNSCLTSVEAPPTDPQLDGIIYLEGVRQFMGGNNNFSSQRSSGTLGYTMSGIVQGSNCSEITYGLNGYNEAVLPPGTSDPSVPSSGATVTNTYAYPVMINIFNAGSVSEIYVNNVLKIQGTAGDFDYLPVILRPRETIKVTGSGYYWTWQAIGG